MAISHGRSAGVQSGDQTHPTWGMPQLDPLLDDNGGQKGVAKAMSGSKDPVRVQPAHRDVLRDLVELRETVGLSAARLEEEDKGVHLKALRAVDHHMSWASLHPGDRHVAAYKVVECSVGMDMHNPDQRWLVERTLNLEGAINNLKERRDRVMQELHISAKAFVRREALAYNHLAAQLVARDTTPCDDHKRYGDAEHRDRRTAKPLRMRVEFEDLDAGVFEVLRVLFRDSRSDVAEACSSILLEQLPLSAATVPIDLRGPLPSWTRARQLILNAVRGEYAERRAWYPAGAPVLTPNELGEVLKYGLLGPDAQGGPIRPGMQADAYEHLDQSIRVLGSRLLERELTAASAEAPREAAAGAQSPLPPEEDVDT
jgi:hypothetical protein